jgi:hypothetical protein
MLVLIRIRERRRASQISEEVQMKLADGGVSTHPITPAPGPAAQPVVPPNGL